MHPTKAQGLDGMPPLFFQKYWHIVVESVIAMALKVLHMGQFPTNLNHTFITLILKKEKVTKVANFCPISLCNVLYKIVAKVIIANRLKMILSSITSKSQSAFIYGRQIMDNIFIADELVHYLRRKKKGKKWYMVIKLDISKAYDRVK